MQAEILDALERPDGAAKARAEADRLDSLGCSWWWRRKMESVEPDPTTGQHTEKIIEECGKLSLPAFLTDFGWSARMSAASVQTATSEAARAADGAERVATVVTLLEDGINRHGARVEAAAVTVARVLAAGGIAGRHLIDEALPVAMNVAAEQGNGAERSPTRLGYSGAAVERGASALEADSDDDPTAVEDRDLIDVAEDAEAPDGDAVAHESVVSGGGQGDGDQRDQQDQHEHLTHG